MLFQLPLSSVADIILHQGYDFLILIFQNVGFDSKSDVLTTMAGYRGSNNLKSLIKKYILYTSLPISLCFTLKDCFFFQIYLCLIEYFV